MSTTPSNSAEFIARTALLMSLVALAIDAMLPALPAIGTDLAVTRSNDSQLVISTLFIGLAVGQLLFGPLSDSVGRKPAIYLGLALFAIGCVMSLLATTLAMMIAGRVLQGFGAAGPRIVVIALVRDRYSGVQMARIMSFVMTVFILVPMVAPALGQGVMMLSSWRGIFVAFLVIAIVACAWLALRQPETLLPERRSRFAPRTIARNVIEVCRNRTAFGYTLATACVFTAFLGYLTSTQPILQVQYGLGNHFPLYFALLSIAIGGASLTNARIVTRFGMLGVARRALLCLLGAAAVFAPFALWLDGHPPLWLLLAWLSASFFCVGLLFANLNALAMEPLGHIAGVGATVVGSLSTMLSLPMGTAIGLAYNGTVLPLLAGFAVFGALAWAAVRWASHG